MLFGEHCCIIATNMSEKLRPGFDYIGISTPFYCHDGKGHLLLAKRTKYARDEDGTWDPGAGLLEHGSSIEANILREIKEEYGCEGTIQKLLPAVNLLREIDGQLSHWLVVAAFVLVNSDDVQLMEPDKFSEIGWFTLDELPSPLHQGFALSFERFKSEFFAMLAGSDET